jgi:hypothetical protein
MITLQSIKQKQDEIVNMISVFETYKEQKLHYPAISIELEAGEKNAGIVLGKDGNPDYFLILLPDDKDDINWQDANTWAKKQGGEKEASLPTRREQSILFGNLKEDFEDRAYWSSEQHASRSDYAWYQTFNLGYQYCSYKSTTMRARAVRRILIIQ